VFNLRMTRALLMTPVLIFTQVARAGSPPVITNVLASQRTDGSLIVDINYDLADADGNTSTVEVEASDDAGMTWDVPVTAVSGDVGMSITPGLSKTIIWNTGFDIPGVFGDQYRVRICADDLVVPADMVLIPAGEYEMGNHHEEFGNSSELPVHAVYIDAFYISRNEVTNHQFEEALDWALAQGYITPGTAVVSARDENITYCATSSGHPQSAIIWTGSQFVVVAGKGGHPMVLVTWYGAAAYANWRSEMDGLQPSYDTTTWECNFDADGYRLPTEAEWEKAARGGLNNPYRVYPWGDSISGANANFAASGDTYEGPGALPHTTPVGYYNGGQSPAGVIMANGYGLYDMVGNVDEWCNDWLGIYYADSPYLNPRGPDIGKEKVLRGGSWPAPSMPEGTSFLRCSARNGTGPGGGATGKTGFRLVLD